MKSLEQRIRNQEPDETGSLRRRVMMAMVIVGQMLPEGSIKGGTAMALRYGRSESLFAQDLDAARAHPLADFLNDFEALLAQGWAEFTGRIVDRRPARPPGIPAAYVMQPFDVKVAYLGRPWRRVKFELGHNEIDDAAEPELRIAPDLVGLFTDLGLPKPGPIPVMRADHQVAQKLHAISEAGGDRVRDLVDLQLLDKGEELDLGQVRATFLRLFDYRRLHAWPPTVEVGAGWHDLYEAEIEGIDVLADLGAAVAWVNELIGGIADA